VKKRLTEMYYKAFPNEHANQLIQYENQIRELKKILQSNIYISKEEVLNLKKSLLDSISTLDNFCSGRK